MTDIIQYNIVNIQSKLIDYTNILPENVEQILNELSKMIVPQEEEGLEHIPMKRNERSFDRGNRNRYNNNNNNKRNKGMTRGGSSNEMTIDDWEAIRNFKPTEKHEKIGIEKHINDIRALLNKISKTNYDNQKCLIVEKISEIFGEGNIENNKQISEVIFQNCSSNKFLSEIYADLYVDLVGFNDLFGNMLDNYIHQFRESLTTITYFDSDENYNDFCDNNKLNENRKSNSAFLINLMIRDMIAKQSVFKLIIDMQNTSFRYIDEENKIHEVEELTENLFILITMSKKILENSEEWKTSIQPNIEKFTKLRAKDHTSLSSRSVFKYMDM